MQQQDKLVFQAGKNGDNVVPRESCLTPQQTQCLSWYLEPGAGRRGLGSSGLHVPRPLGAVPTWGSAPVSVFLGTEGLESRRLQSLCFTRESGVESAEPRKALCSPPPAWATVIAVEPQSLETALISCLRSSWLMDGSRGPTPYPRSCTNLQTTTILANRQWSVKLHHGRDGTPSDSCVPVLPCGCER